MSEGIKNSIRIIIIDDHLIFRAGLRILIEGDPKFLVVGESGNRSEALSIVRREQPDVILLDLMMGSESGFDYIPDLISVAEKARILILTGVQDTKLYHRALQLGAVGVVAKQEAVQTLLKAIEKVHSGEAWIDRTTVTELLTEISHSRSNRKAPSEKDKIEALTKRELTVIKHISRGLKNRQIADSLCISEVTVRHHLTSIFSKLELADRYELIIFAYKNGLSDSSI